MVMPDHSSSIHVRPIAHRMSVTDNNDVVVV